MANESKWRGSTAFCLCTPQCNRGMLQVSVLPPQCVQRRQSSTLESRSLGLASRVLRRMRSVSQSALQKLRLPTNRCVVFRCSVGDRHCPAVSTNARTTGMRKTLCVTHQSHNAHSRNSQGHPKITWLTSSVTFRSRLAPPSHTKHSDAHESPDIS